MLPNNQPQRRKISARCIWSDNAPLPRISFAEVGLLPGTVLTFIKDPTITCTVADHNKVEFRGEVTSLSASALIVLNELGYARRQVSGREYWTHEGVKLSKIGPRA